MNAQNIFLTTIEPQVITEAVTILKALKVEAEAEASAAPADKPVDSPAGGDAVEEDEVQGVFCVCRSPKV